ncbi:hypothetical protein H1R20_g12575, partial [Candolleomyces eurysporus]
MEEAVAQVAPSAEPEPVEAANVDKDPEPAATGQVKPSEGEGLTVQTTLALNGVKANDTEATASPAVGPDSKPEDKKSRKKDKARKKAKKLADEKAAAAAQEAGAEGTEEPAPEATLNTPAKLAKLEPIKTQDLQRTEPLIDFSGTPRSAVQPLPKNNAWPSASPTTTRGPRPPLSERLSKATPSARPPNFSSPSSAKAKEENNPLKRFTSLWN